MTLALLGGGLFLLDRATKYWAQVYLYPRSPIRVTAFFQLTYVENTGAAFGFLQGGNAFFILVSAALLGSLWWWRRRLSDGASLSRYAVALVAAGAVGNLYDRLVFGHVVDFFDFLVWPVFNVADSCISVGAACLALSLGRKERR